VPAPRAQLPLNTITPRSGSAACHNPHTFISTYTS
jgi:hypothetical protein